MPDRLQDVRYELALASRRTRQHESGDVRAADEEHETDRAHENEDQSPSAAHGFVVHRRHRNRQTCDDVPNGRGIVIEKRGNEARELGARLLDRDARLQPGDDRTVVHHAECLPFERHEHFERPRADTLLDNADSRHRLAGEITALANEHRVAVVHGGGKQMTRFLEERGVESKFVNALRVTTDDLLDAVLKIFAGSVNAELVSAFRNAGAQPVGLSGLDAGLVDAEPLDPALGHVGRPVRADARLLDLLTQSGYLPVVACVAGDPQGRAFNVNGDQMAATCAAAFGVTKLMFLTDVEGVRDAQGVRPVLTAAEAASLIETGVAVGGMQAKLNAALFAMAQGVSEIVIGPGACPGIIPKLAAGAEIGTRLVA